MSDQEPYDPENEPGKRNQIAAGEEASSSAPERMATVYGCEEGAVLFPNAKAEAAFVRDGGPDAAGVSVDLGPVHADEFDPSLATPPQPRLSPPEDPERKAKKKGELMAEPKVKPTAAEWFDFQDTLENFRAYMAMSRDDLGHGEPPPDDWPPSEVETKEAERIVQEEHLKTGKAQADDERR